MIYRALTAVSIAVSRCTGGLPGETLCARAYRTDTLWAVRIFDMLLAVREKDHCLMCRVRYLEKSR